MDIKLVCESIQIRNISFSAFSLIIGVSFLGALLSTAEQSLYMESHKGQWSQTTRGSCADAYPKGVGSKALFMSTSLHAELLHFTYFISFLINFNS